MRIRRTDSDYGGRSVAWGDDLGALADQRGPALVGYAYLLTGDLDRAEDLVQEALVKAFSRRAPGRDDVEWAEAYVRRAILNTFLDGYRRGRLWRGVRHLLTEAPAREGPAAVSEARIDVRAALLRLPPQERACVVLRFYEDLTVPAVAERLNISAGAAKRYLSDGVHRLERLLGPLPDTHLEDIELVETGRIR
ncbi:sigma-70 family RNA polymerase sigma factor [Pengzhenrongella phosphoraccumulans]|uniref:sigma-70 family RNA polymerase sigma factor n=1 Tax=Pengzhenrongella phosphoraccumulans TaxID=3114394 RepID=UPI003890EB91